MNELTERQRAILEFITERIAHGGLPPTLAEIAEAFGFRQARAARGHLRLLQDKGYLELLPGKARGIRLRAARAPGHRAEAVPLIGRVAAGRPILAEAHVERLVALDPALFRPRADFLLRVRGDSMNGAGILDGDLIAVHRSATADDGRIVVARLGDEVTVKRLRLGPDGVRLLAENPAYPAITVDPRRDAFAIEGLYVGVIRA